MATHQKRIRVVTGSHIHRAEFRSSMSALWPDLDVPFLVTPSVSPVYNNNPGFSFLEMTESEVTDLKIYSF